MKTFLGFITGIFIGAIGFVITLLCVEDSPKFIEDMQKFIFVK